MNNIEMNSIGSDFNDLVKQHYQRPEVRETILRYAECDDGFRALNGDSGWYTTCKNAKVRLRTLEDYDDTTDKFRTLYATIDILNPSVKQVSEEWDDNKNCPVKPIGTLRNCQAFTLSVDIDSINGPNGENIITSPEIRHAVEDAAQFFVDYLRDNGISQSVFCLYSGGGAYIHIHHALFRAKSDWSEQDKEDAFRHLTEAYNNLIAAIANDFFAKHPDHIGKVKFDKLNNQKRKFKTIFSVHKKHDLAVIPLDPAKIKIDIEQAKLPLSDEIVASGERWYAKYEPRETEKMQALLKPFAQYISQNKNHTKVQGIFRHDPKLDVAEFAPCMLNIIKNVATGRGPHRALAVLASYLYTAGWSEDEAFKLWNGCAERVDVEPRIFDCWYGQMVCPKCETLGLKSSGYPSVGLGEFGYCEQNENCCGWPGSYGTEDEFEIEIISDAKPKVKPRVIVSDRDLHNLTMETLKHLIKWNNPPIIFKRRGMLYRIHNSENELVLELLTEKSLRAICVEAINFEKRRKGNVFVDASPPKELIENILAQDTWPGIPTIDGIVNIPVLRKDGSILFKNGYDPESHLYLDSSLNLTDDDVPDKPTQEDAMEAARYILDEVFYDFPFEDNASRTNTVAALATIVSRQLIDGLVPLTVVDKPQPGSGAGLLTDLVTLITTGETAHTFTAPTSETEWIKSITAALMTGRQVCVIDNVKGTLRSSALNSMLTTAFWEARILGVSKQANLPNKTCWLANGNNIRVGGEGGDLIRRSMVIRIIPNVPQPWMRSKFKHSRIKKWVKNNHKYIIIPLLIIVRAWANAGKPKSEYTLGSFEEWAETVGGMMEFAGLTDFMGNAKRMYDEMDVDSEKWDAFLTIWRTINGKQEIKLMDLMDQINGKYQTYKKDDDDTVPPKMVEAFMNFKEAMPDEIAEIFNKNNDIHNTAREIGKILYKHKNQVFPSGLKLEAVKNPHNKSNMWRVHRVKIWENMSKNSSKTCDINEKTQQTASAGMGQNDNLSGEGHCTTEKTPSASSAGISGDHLNARSMQKFEKFVYRDRMKRSPLIPANLDGGSTGVENSAGSRPMAICGVDKGDGTKVPMCNVEENIKEQKHEDTMVLIYTKNPSPTDEELEYESIINTWTTDQVAMIEKLFMYMYHGPVKTTKGNHCVIAFHICYAIDQLRAEDVVEYYLLRCGCKKEGEFDEKTALVPDSSTIDRIEQEWPGYSAERDLNSKPLPSELQNIMERIVKESKRDGTKVPPPQHKSCLSFNELIDEYLVKKYKETEESVLNRGFNQRVKIYPKEAVAELAELGLTENVFINRIVLLGWKLDAGKVWWLSPDEIVKGEHNVTRVAATA
jgi:hypothetical protein